MELACKICGGMHTTGACIEDNKPKPTGEQIGDAFKAIAGGVREGVQAKIAEYDTRIRAAKAGQPRKPGDTATNLLSDFKRFAGEDWTENFDINQPQKKVTGPEIREPVDSESINQFILKLAEDNNLNENDAVISIVKQIRLLESNPDFPSILTALDPDQYHSQTKLLSKAGQQRLRGALNQYLKKS